MDVIRLNRLARQLREIALQASQGGAELPISVAQLAVIEAVARHPDSTVSMISKSTGLAQSWVSKIVRELSEEGVFANSKDPHDRRRTRVRLGEETRRQTFESHGGRAIDEAIAHSAPHLDASGLRRVTELLTEIGSLLDSPPAEVGAAAARVLTS